MEEDEYELVPLNPLRKMEKRLDKLEKSGTSNEMLKEMVDILKANQQIVDDIVRINSDAINKITELTQAVNASVTKVDNFMSRIEVSGEEAKTQEEGAPTESKMPEMEARLDKMEKRINTLILSTLAKNKLRSLPRPQQRPMM